MAQNPNCTVKIQRLSQLMDNYQNQRFNPLSGKSGITPDTFWKTVNGYALQNVGPGTPELNVNDYISLASRVRRYGPAGAELTDKILRAQEMLDINTRIYERRALEILEPLKTEQEWANLREVIEQRSAQGLLPGKRMPPVGSKSVAPMNENVRIAAEFLNSRPGSGGLLDQLATIAEQEGILKQREKNYWPIIYPTSLLEEQGFKETILKDRALEFAQKRIAKQRGVKTSSVSVTEKDLIGEDYANAKLIFDRYIIPQYAVVAPHIEMGREWDVAGRIDDPRILIPTYIRQMWRRIVEKRVFGERDHFHDFPRKAKELLGQIQINNGDNAYNEALTMVKDFVGITPSDPTMNSVILRTLSNMQGLKLSLSALRNASQFMNTALRGDFSSLAKAWYLYLKDGELQGFNVRELAKDIGGAADLALYESTLYRAHDRFGKFVEKTLQATGFTPTERMLRVFSGLSGAIYANKQAQRFLNGAKDAAQRLLELGIDPTDVRRNGGITHQDMLLAGRRFIDETQFRTRAADLPFFAQTPLWRFLLQFRTFSINQSRFLVRELQRRPARTLLFSFGAMPAVGFGLQLLQDMALELLPWFEPRKHETRSGLEIALESWASAGSFGLLSDFAWAAFMSGESKMFANFFTPPGIGTLNDLTTIIGELGRGKGTAAFRDFARQFGGLGAAFGRYVAPPRGFENKVTTIEELDEWLSL